MIEEIRIYYESIEQGCHYIYKIINDQLSKLDTKNVPIKLIRRGSNYKFYAKKVAPIIYRKDPDILITTITNKEEIPLIIIEFSNAVYTKDHELQRVDGLSAAKVGSCLYVKISSTIKKSDFEHGGEIDYDYTIPYRAVFQHYGLVTFHFEWPLDKKYNKLKSKKDTVLLVDKGYLSCPPRIAEFDLLIFTILKIITKSYDTLWVKDVCEELKEDVYFKRWFKKLNGPLGENYKELNSSRTKWFEKHPLTNMPTLELKFNRFGHAMDPERGMLCYFGIFLDDIVPKVIMDPKKREWYDGVSKQKEIEIYIKENKLERVYDFLYCFMLAFGLSQKKFSEFSRIINEYKNDKSQRVVIDIGDFVNENFAEFNSPLKTIIRFSKFFVILDERYNERVILKWSSITEINFKKNPNLTFISERKNLSEDDITYISVHNILKPNGYKIIAVSYPGAQADRKILIKEKKGRTTPRKYPDIISFLPKEITSLQQNKGIFQKFGVQSDINYLNKYKTDDKYKEGLKLFQKNYEPNSLGSVIKIGIGFWSSKNFKLSSIKDIDIKELDYYIFITCDMREWIVCSIGNNNIFNKRRGKVEIPKTFEVVESHKNISLCKFLSLIKK